MATRVVDLLRRTDIFERLAEPELLKVAKLLRERKFGEDQVLFQQGDQGSALYLIVRGRVKISITDQLGHEKVLAFLGEGEIFGEMAVLTGAPRSASAEASTDLRVLELRKDDFDVLLANNVEVLKEMLRVVNLRQAVTTQRLNQEASEGGAARGLVTLVYSPRGGSGKSTLAANLAVALAQATPDRVVLVDLNLLFPHQAVLLSLTPRSSLAAVTPAALGQLDRDSFTYYLTAHEESSLRLLVGALRPEDGETVTGEHVRAMIDLLRRQFVHVVVDAPSDVREPTLVALELADRVLVVATSDSGSGGRDLVECRRVFHEVLGYDRQRFGYVLNHVLPYNPQARQHVEATLGEPLAAEIPYGGDGPALAGLEGAPLVSRQPGNPSARAILALAADVDRGAREALALAAA